MRRARCTRTAVLVLLLGGVPLPAAAQTDLVASITSITVNGTQVMFNLQVCNPSSTKAPNSQVALYYHLAAAPDCATAPSQTWMVMSLNPSECKTINHTQANATAGKLVAWARADYNCQVSESNETNNNSSKAYTVAGDLQVQTVTAAVAGNTVTYTVTIRNSGVTVTTPFTLALYYDLPLAPTCTSTASQTWTINGLASSGTVTQQHVRTNAPAGSYEAWALVDSGCVVEEGNEANNVASKTYGVGPDITLSPATAAVSGTSVIYSVQVCNHGTVATGAFSVKLWYNGTAAPGCATGGADHTWSVTSLPAWSGDPSASCTTLTHARNAPAGNYQAWFLADAACAVAESDETNNVRSTFYAISPGAPDLFVSSFSATTSGSTATFTALVCNAGLPIAAPFQVGFYYNRTGAPGCAPAADAVVTQAALASGSCATVNHVRSGAPAGSYTGWAMADPGCAIAESNEGNNSASAGYVVTAAAADLGVPDAALVTDGSPELDSKVTSPDAKGDGVRADGARADGAGIDAGPIPAGDSAAGEAGVAGDLGGDAAKPLPPKDEGCGCSVAGPEDGLCLMLALGLLLGACRRRRADASRR